MQEMKFFRFYFSGLACRQTGFILSRKANGFSLIELMVAVGIMALINIMIFANYPEFSQKMALKRTSEEIALIARQAQVYALGIKKLVSAGDDYFGFGIHFETSNKNKNTLILFADSDSDKTYDNGELFQEFKIGAGDYISELWVCASFCQAVSALDIVYPRAASMATINNDDTLSYSKITIKSPRGNEEKNKKYIKIWISGQISVE